MYGTAATTMVGLARDTGDPAWRAALEFQLAGGNLPGALDAARVWARLSPNDLEASSTELALAAANGQTRGLSQALRNRIDASRDKPAAIGQALAVLSRLNDRRLALRILDESFSDGVRKLPAAHMALADVANAAGDDERAAQEARAALAADPKSEPAAQRVLEYGFKVDPQRAQTEARAYIARNPNARKVRLMLAGQLADSGDYNAALAELQAMSRRSPEDFDLLFMQAQLAYKAGQLQQARTLLQQYLDVQNQRQRATVPGATDAGAAAADAHVLLSRIAEDQGRYDEAINELGRIEDPTLRYSVRMRGRAARQGRPRRRRPVHDRRRRPAGRGRAHPGRADQGADPARRRPRRSGGGGAGGRRPRSARYGGNQVRAGHAVRAPGPRGRPGAPAAPGHRAGPGPCPRLQRAGLHAGRPQPAAARGAGPDHAGAGAGAQRSVHPGQHGLGQVPHGRPGRRGRIPAPRLQHASRGRHRRPPGRSAVEPGQARPGGGAAARRQAQDPTNRALLDTIKRLGVAL